MKYPPPLPYSPEVESVPPDEARDIEQVLEKMRSLLQEDAQSSGLKRRDVHVKSHGCPVGQFTVLSGLPDELRQGVFEQERSYPAAVRFSNSSPRPLPDAIPDARGVAIKLTEVTGEFIIDGATDPGAQDFVMVDAPAFMVRDVKDYLEIERLRLENIRRPQAGLKALTSGSWNPLRWNWGGALAAVRVAARFPIHPVWLTYYSMTPFRFGAYIAKYRLRPSTSAPRLAWMRSNLQHRDGFRLALEKMLRSSGLSFEFEVQLRSRVEQMPIEDATAIWPESESPYRPVARLTIPPQELNASPFERGDALSFNVWNTLDAHRPLGGINRSRRAAYQLSNDWRRSVGTE